MKEIRNKFSFDFAIIAFMIIFLIMDEEANKFIAGGFFVLLISYHFLMHYIIYITLNKEETNGLEQLEIIEPPSDMHPAVVSYFVREKVDLHIVYAVLLSLVNNRKLKMEKVGDDYLFTLLDKTISMKPIDEYVLSWLFSDSKKTINMNDFKNRYGYRNNHETLKRHLRDIQTILEEEVFHLTKNIEDAKTKMRLKIAASSFVVAFLEALATNYMGIFTIFLYSMLFTEIERATKKNQKGAMEYNKWKSYSSFLKKRIETERRSVHEIILWDYHMTYALSLGVASRALDELDWLRGDVIELMNATGRQIYR